MTKQYRPRLSLEEACVVVDGLNTLIEQYQQMPALENGERDELEWIQALSKRIATAINVY